MIFVTLTNINRHDNCCHTQYNTWLTVMRQWHNQPTQYNIRTTQRQQRQVVSPTPWNQRPPFWLGKSWYCLRVDQSTLMSQWWDPEPTDNRPQHYRHHTLTISMLFQSYCARYWYKLDVCPSVCLSVRHTLVLCRNGSTYRQTVFMPGSPMILVFWGPNFSRNSNGNTPTRAWNARDRKKLQFPTNLFIYNGIVRKVHE